MAMAMNWKYTRLVAGAAALSCCASFGWAEQAVPVTASQPATASQKSGAVDAAALRKEADALLDGTSPGLNARAVALLQKAAAAGDVTAQTRLGKILLDGYYVPAEPVVRSSTAVGRMRAVSRGVGHAFSMR